MKALVLAGGLGTRLRPLTLTTPKQLIPVANKPVLFYGLEAISSAGIKETAVIVGDQGQAVRDVVGSGAAFGLDITYISQDAPRGLAHCVWIARDFLGDDDFVMYLGDNVIFEGLDGLVEEYRRSRPAALIMVGKVPEPSQYGVAQLDADGRVISLEEKPPVPRSDLALIGAYVFSPEIHRAVRSIGTSERGELEITHALSWLVERGRPVLAHVASGYWKDTGRPDDLLDCNEAVLATIDRSIRGEVDDLSLILGPVVVEPTARVLRSRIVGPAVIGAGATIVDSEIGPHTSVGAGCSVVASRLESSILLEGTLIERAGPIRRSLFGRSVTIRRDST